ncbi:uncharacterized protein LOC127862033 isoform X2 [Dreissena polymorpha]|nr:uncharacterized protein LOC127862033 isoform X2 [Dreissena polymorpha]XP_052256947.1 uncharacterized protein LOC127862033 isoform X2 [Dreissena polymorpha]KAH3894172.1 hypothetical protein DPMN_018329 [Dreissena polymorpha]
MLTETNSKINFMKELISVKNKNSSTMKPCEQSSGSPMCWSPSQSAYTSTQARSHVGSPGHLATLRRASNPDHTPTPHDSPDSTVHFLCRTPMSLAVDRNVADVSTPPYQMHPKTHAAHNSGVFLHGCSPLVTHVLPSEVKCITENNETLKSGKPDYHSAARFRQRVSPLFPQALPVDLHYSDADMSRTAVYKTENTFSEDIFESECPYAIPGLCDSQDCYVNSIETTHAESLALSTSPRLRLEDYNLDYYYKKPEGFIAKPMSPAIPCIYEARDSSGVVYDYSQLQELVDTISYHEHRGDVDSSLHGEIPEDIYSSTISEDEGRKGEADTISFVIRRNVDEVKRAMSHGDLRQNMGSIATVPKSSPFVKGTGELMKEYTNIKGIHKSEYEGGSRPERINVSKYEPTIVHVTNNTFSGDVNCSSLYCDPNDRRQESHRTHDDRYMNHKEAYRKSGVSVDRRFGPYLIEGDGRKRRCSLFRDRSPSYHSERAYFNHRRKSIGRSHECASRKSNECARRRSPKMEKRQSQERTSRRSYERYRERVKRTRYR